MQRITSTLNAILYINNKIMNKKEKFVKTAKPHVAKANTELEEEILEEIEIEDPREDEAARAVESNRRKTL